MKKYTFFYRTCNFGELQAMVLFSNRPAHKTNTLFFMYKNVKTYLQAFLLLFCACISTIAQDFSPMLWVKTAEGTFENQAMKSYQAEVTIVGRKVFSEIILEFDQAPKNVVGEGIFVLPIGKEFTIRRFAVQTDSMLREAFVVENSYNDYNTVQLQDEQKNKLIQAFPPNSYPSFVYTIQRIKANKRQKISISYDYEMLATVNQYRFFLSLPQTTLEKIAISIQSPSKPSMLHSEYKNLVIENNNFNKIEKNSQLFVFQALNFSVKYDFVGDIEYKGEDKIFTHKSSYQPFAYFYAEIEPCFLEKEEKELPKKIILFYDQSYSGKNRNRELETNILNRYLKKIKEVEFRVIGFSNEVQNDKTFIINNGNFNDIRKYLYSLDFDGATNLNALNFEEYEADEYIILSDGEDDFGKKTHRAISRKPIICLNSAKKNTPIIPQTLFELAASSGGVYIDLNTTAINEVINQMLFLPCQLLGVEYEKSDFGNVQMQKTPLGLQFSGKLLHDLGTITLQYGRNGKVKATKQIEIATSNYTRGSLFEGIWIGMELANLSKNYEQNHKIIRELSKKHNIAAKGTSWILPETVADYLHYGLEPPKDLYKFYKKHISHKNINLQNEDTEDVSSEQYAFKKTSNLYAKRRVWYDKNFSADIQDELEYGRTDFASQENENDMYFWNVQEVLTDSALVAQQKAVAVHTTQETVYKSHTQYSLDNSGFEGQVWTAEKDYLRTLEAAELHNRYRSYKALRESREYDAAFYADVANLFFEWGEKTNAIKILSNVVEIYPNNPIVLKMLGNRLMSMNRAELALPIFERILFLSPQNPHSYRDLGLCYETLGQNQQAIDYLYEVVANSWDSKFLSLQDLVLGEINRLLARSTHTINIHNMPSELRKPMALDIRILLEWDNPNVDMDLYVIDPNEDKAYYGNTETKMGGKISTHSASNYYNPEEFILKNAEQGEYWTRIHHYQKKNQAFNTPTLVTLTMFTNYGRPNEEKKVYTYRMTNEQTMIDSESLNFTAHSFSKKVEEARYQTIKTDETVQLVSYSPDNKYIAVAHDYDISIYKIDSNKLIKTIKDVSVGGVLFKQIVFNPQSSQILVLGDSTLIPSETMNDLNSEEFWNDEWQEEGSISVIKLLDLEKGILQKSYTITDSAVTQVAFSADGKSFVAMSLYGISKVDILTGTVLKNILRPMQPFHTTIANENFLATADKDSIIVRELVSFKIIKALAMDNVSNLQIADNGKSIAFLRLEKNKHKAYVIHFQANNKDIVSSFDLFYRTGIPKIGVFALSPDARFVAAQPYGTNQVVVKSTEENADDIIEYYHQSLLTALSFSKDGNLLVSASKDNIIRIRDMRKLPFASINTEGNEFDFDIDTQGLNLTIAEENKISFFSRNKNVDKKFFRIEHFADTLNMLPVEGAKNIALSTAKENGYITYFDKIEKKIQLNVLALHNNIASNHSKPNFEVFANTLLAPLETFGTNFDFKQASILKLSPDGKLLVFDQDTTIKMLALKNLKNAKPEGFSKNEWTRFYNDKCLQTIYGHHADKDKKRIEKIKGNAAILCLEFSKDGKYMVSKGIDKSVKVWNVKNGECLSTYTSLYDASPQVQFSADGKYILFEDTEHLIKIWDWQQAKLVGELIGHKSSVTYIDTDATGTYYLTCSKDNSIKVWDSKTFACIRTYYDNAPRKVRFCDTNSFVSSGKDAYLKFWKIW
jgi:WD40 repeat protein